MKIPPIPKYSDSENEVFHPVFHYALECALTTKGLSSEIEVARQFKAPGGGLVDLVLLRKNTKKVVLPIELKRTISSVRGLGRRQARDYQLNLTAQSENNYYCASNLELTELFLSDSHRPTTLSQQIKLDSPQNVRLENNQNEDLLPSLIKVVEEIIDIVILKVKTPRYLVGLTYLEKVLHGNSASLTDWHESIMPYCFEYIRGNSTLKPRTKSWKPAGAYKSNPQRLVDLGSSIDFHKIFSSPASKSTDFKTSVLQEGFAAGQAYGDGDDLAALVGDILFEPQFGIVETDYDLARLLAALVATVAGKISDNDCILDPCAGSGKLLTALIHEKYPQLKPENVIAVEQVPYFAEALSLRLGLQFGNKITQRSCPKIIIAPFESLGKEIFKDTSIAVVNPPFVAGINAVVEKNKLEQSLISLTGKKPELGAGQLGLEALFMELVYKMVPDNTTIAFIFPFPAISRLSREYAKLRNFLVDNMGVSHVVTYPSEGVFESVVKKTLIMICKKGWRPENVELINIQISVPDLDLSAFSNALSNPTGGCYGVQFASISRSQMVSCCSSGWKKLFGIGVKVNEFIAKYAGLGKSLDDYAPDMRRGTVGNSGNTALTVFTKDSVPVKIPERWMIGCLNNARNMPRFVDVNSAPNISFLPPDSSFSEGTKSNEELVRLVTDYVKKCNGVFSTKKQKTDIKTFSGIVNDLKKDQRLPATNSIVIPRACREDAKVGVIGNDPILVSTNFLILPVADDQKRILLASWLQSIFGQLQIELFSTPDEGMRKLEKNALSRVYVPDLEAIPKNIQKKLVEAFMKEPFISLDDVKARESDFLWALQLVPKDAKATLDEGIMLLKEAYDDRVQ